MIIETGVGNGILSPTGDLTAQLANGEVCFVPDTGARNCGELAVGVVPTFAVFAQDGDHLLVVAGPQNAAIAYVFDTSSGVAQVLGPQGVQDFARLPEEGRWPAGRHRRCRGQRVAGR